MAVTHNALHRFIQGVTNHAASHPLGLMTLKEDPTQWSIFFDDFNSMQSTGSMPIGDMAAAEGDDFGNWEFTEGIDNDWESSFPTGSPEQGVLSLASEGAILAETIILNQAARGGFLLSSTSVWVMEARWSLHAATDTDGAAFIGLATDTDEAGLFAATATSIAAANALGFGVFNASNNIDATFRVGSVSTSIATIGTCGTTAEKWQTTSLACDGATVRAYLDGALQTNTVSTGTSTPTTVVYPTISFEQDGSTASAVTGQIDYFLFAVQTTDRD